MEVCPCCRRTAPCAAGGPRAWSWFHVTHRAVGRRPLFARRADLQAYLQLIAEQVREGLLEVHAWSLLTTHVHLLVRSRPALLAAALRRAGSVYARRLNRRLQRVGPLFGGRPLALPIRSSAHWRAVLAYIDRNAVEAGLASRPCAYPWGSAWHYARASGPEWLSRGVVEAWVRRRSGTASYRPEDYARSVHAQPEAAGLVERRLSKPAPELDPLDDLLGAAAPRVRAWLERRAREADGGAAGPVLVSPETLLRVVEGLRAARGSWPLARRRPGQRPSSAPGRRRDGWSVLLAGLMRSAGGLALQEIADRLGFSVAGVHGLVACHEHMVVDDPGYAEVVQRALRAALARDHGAGGPPRGRPQ